MNTENSIFSRGRAFNVHEYINFFLFLFYFKIANNVVYSNALAIMPEAQLSFLAVLCQISASLMLTGYDIGCKLRLQLKNSLKQHKRYNPLALVHSSMGVVGWREGAG